MTQITNDQTVDPIPNEDQERLIQPVKLLNTRLCAAPPIPPLYLHHKLDFECVLTLVCRVAALP